METSTWGLVAAQPTTAAGFRSDISHPADGSTVTDAVVVFNRSAQPVTVDLSVIGATFTGKSYDFTSVPAASGPRIDLGARQVTVPGREQARIAVTIHEPSHLRAVESAGIAAEAAPIDDGALSIQQRLVVVVRSTPATAAPLLPPDVTAWAVAGAVVLIGAAAYSLRERRRLQAVAA